jgi:hypothetical protein
MQRLYFLFFTLIQQYGSVKSDRSSKSPPTPLKKGDIILPVVRWLGGIVLSEWDNLWLLSHSSFDTLFFDNLWAIQDSNL